MAAFNAARVAASTSSVELLLGPAASECIRGLAERSREYPTRIVNVEAFLARGFGMAQLANGGGWRCVVELADRPRDAKGVLWGAASLAAALEGVLLDFADLKSAVRMVTRPAITPDGLVHFSLVCLRTVTKVR